MGARGASKQLSQTSSCYCLDSLKCIFFSFALRALPQHQACPEREHSPGCSPPGLAARGPAHLVSIPVQALLVLSITAQSQPYTKTSAFPPGLTSSFKMYRQPQIGMQRPGCVITQALSSISSPVGSAPSGYQSKVLVSEEQTLCCSRYTGAGAAGLVPQTSECKTIFHGAVSSFPVLDK